MVMKAFSISAVSAGRPHEFAQQDGRELGIGLELAQLLTKRSGACGSARASRISRVVARARLAPGG